MWCGCCEQNIFCKTWMSNTHCNNLTSDIFAWIDVINWIIYLHGHYHFDARLASGFQSVFSTFYIWQTDFTKCFFKLLCVATDLTKWKTNWHRIQPSNQRLHVSCLMKMAVRKIFLCKCLPQNAVWYVQDVIKRS